MIKQNDPQYSMIEYNQMSSKRDSLLACIWNSNSTPPEMIQMLRARQHHFQVTKANNNLQKDLDLLISKIHHYPRTSSTKD